MLGQHSYQILILLQGVTGAADAIDLFLHLGSDRCFRRCFLLVIRGIARQFLLEERQKGLRVEQRGQLGGVFDLPGIDVRGRSDRRVGAGVRAHEVEENDVVQRFIDQGELVDDAMTADDVFGRVAIARGVEEQLVRTFGEEKVIDLVETSGRRKERLRLPVAILSIVVTRGLGRTRSISAMPRRSSPSSSIWGLKVDLSSARATG